MAVYYSPEKIKEIVKEYAGDENNTGHIEAQIALITYRIGKLSDHLRENKKDNSCKRTLLSLVGQRRKLLRYYQNRDILAYRALIEKLGIRK